MSFRTQSARLWRRQSGSTRVGDVSAMPTSGPRAVCACRRPLESATMACSAAETPCRAMCSSSPADDVVPLTANTSTSTASSFDGQVGPYLDVAARRHGFPAQRLEMDGPKLLFRPRAAVSSGRALPLVHLRSALVHVVEVRDLRRGCSIRCLARRGGRVLYHGHIAEWCRSGLGDDERSIGGQLRRPWPLGLL